MENLLKAKPLIEERIPQLRKECNLLTKQGLQPKLNVILVGNNDASLRYVGNKEKFCQRIGAKFELIKLPESISEDDFLGEIIKMNNDLLVTGCFVQLPVPKHLSHLDITQLINPEKDVDGFHLNTVNNLYLGKLDKIIPCTPKGILTLLEDRQIEISGANIVIIGRSHIVGKPLSLLLQAKDATVTLCHSKTKDLKDFTQKADIIISAVGVAHLIKAEHINQSRAQIIIDVGMNRLEGKLVGDVDTSEVAPLVKAITPVPGGVGPMTVFSLMENLIKTTKNIISKTKA